MDLDRRDCLLGVAIGMGALAAATNPVRAASSQGITSRTVERAGAKLYVESEGTGEPVLLLHGGLGHMGVFAGLRKQLVNMGRQAVLIDTRGMGRSSLGSETLSYGVQEQDAYAVMDALAIRACPVVGFSDGGIVGYRMAASPTSRVNRLVTIGSRWSAENGRAMWEAFDSWDRAFFEASDFRFLVDDYDRLSPDGDFDRMMKQAAAMWKDSGPDGHPEAAIDSIAVPVLIAVGDSDPFLSVNDAADAKRRIAGASLLVLPNAGHDAFVQRPSVFEPALGQFLTAES